MVEKTVLAALVASGENFAVRVTPKAARDRIVVEETPDLRIKVYVTCVPEDGKANKAVIKLLAKAMGVAKSRLLLRRGATSRDKVFCVLP